MEPRPGPQRKADMLRLLNAEKADAWVATANSVGVAHLVPLSFAWDGRRLILATRPSSPTARNITAGKRARVALGHTRDVVIVDATVEEIATVGAAPSLAEAYGSQADWDPRQSDGDWVFITLLPVTVQAWREENELDGRWIMRGGAWLD